MSLYKILREFLRGLHQELHQESEFIKDEYSVFQSRDTIQNFARVAFEIRQNVPSELPPVDPSRFSPAFSKGILPKLFSEIPPEIPTDSPPKLSQTFHQELELISKKFLLAFLLKILLELDQEFNILAEVSLGTLMLNSSKRFCCIVSIIVFGILSEAPSGDLARVFSKMPSC